jgi:hypothetical protein
MSKTTKNVVGLGLTGLAIFGGYTLFKRWRAK